MNGRGGRGGRGAVPTSGQAQPAPGASRQLTTLGGRDDETRVDERPGAGTLTKVPSLRVENLSEAKIITKEQLSDLIALLRSFEDRPTENEDILRTISEQKQKYIFASMHLMQLLQVTPSIKTRISIIESIAGRLTDPKAKVAEFLALFKNSDQKQQVEEMLKVRALTLDSAKLLVPGGPGRGGPLVGGRGGRGGGGSAGGRGTLAHSRSMDNVTSPPISLEPPPVQLSSVAEGQQRGSLRSSLSLAAGTGGGRDSFRGGADSELSRTRRGPQGRTGDAADARHQGGSARSCR